MLRTLANSPVSDVPRRSLVLCLGGDRLGLVVARMKDSRRGSAVIQDGVGRIVGIFTQHDLMKRVDLNNEDWPDTAVQRYMTLNPTTIQETQSLALALQLMAQGKFRTVPIVDRMGQPVGVVSVRDVFRHIADSFPEDFLNLPPDAAHEATRLYGG